MKEHAIRTSRRLSFHLVIVLGLLTLLAFPWQATNAQIPPSIAAIEAEHSAIALDLVHTRELQDTDIDLRIARLHIKHGSLVPTTAVRGQVREWLFIGEARLALDPPDRIEAQQLELYTDKDTLRETVRQAVLVLTNDAAISALARHAATPASAELSNEANTLFTRWLDGGERRKMNVDDAVLLDALGDPLYDSYFAALFHGDSLGDFLCVVEPEQFEQVTVGRFEPIDLTRREKRKAQRMIAKQQRKGRWIGLELEGLGDFENWISMPLKDSQGAPQHGAGRFDVLHYDLDISLAPKSLELTGHAQVNLRAESGRQALRLVLSADLAVHKVSLAGGSDLFFRQRGSDLLVVLPKIAATDEEMTLVIDYSGDAIGNIPRTTARVLNDTEHWYPSVSTTDYATYDMIFHWPKKLQLFAAGTRGEAGLEGTTHWQRFRIERPSLLASFEIGRYQIEERKAGHTDITIAFDATAKLFISGDRDKLIDAVGGALTYFEEIFGPYPYDHLTVVTAPRALSQSLPAMVTLSSIMLSDQGVLRALIGTYNQDRRGVIAHEIAHQWWGHTVGWQSYRDQWISEATAEYAANLYMRNRLGLHHSGPTTNWQSDMIATTDDGRKIESIGPLVLGARLGSGPAPEAYSSIVYEKGAVVLDMLARRFGEKTFLLILRRILEAVPGRALSTADFLQLIERLTDVDLTAFADQFIYATGLPEVYYDLRFEHLDNGHWAVAGTARQEPPYRYVYRIAQSDDGSFDVLRDRVDEVDLEKSALIVPVMISLYDPAKKDGAKNASVTGNKVAIYHTMLRGRSTDLRVELELEPKMVRLDPNQVVFARFFDRHHYPKRMLYYEGLDLAAAHRYDEAEARMREALDAEVTVGPSLAADQDQDEDALEIAGLRLDDRISRALTRIYLDQGRSQSAGEAFEKAATARSRADKLAHYRRTGPPAEALRLEARLAMHKGDAKKAYSILYRAIHKDGTLSSRESQALLAVAAQRVGEEKVMDEALEQARDLGVDVSPLEG